jgi:hypothetical protein
MMGLWEKPMNKELGFVMNKGAIHMVFFECKFHLQDMVVQSDGRSTSSQMLFSKREFVATLALGLWPKQGLARLPAKKEAREWRNAATLALGSQPRQGLTRLRAKKKAQEWRKVWGNEPSHCQRSFHFGSSSFEGLLNVQRAIARVKNQWLEEFFIPLENYWNVDV